MRTVKTEKAQPNKNETGKNGQRKTHLRLNNRGESLAETLVAILICALAATSLAGMVIGANHLLQKGNTMMDSIYSAETRLEKNLGGDTTGAVSGGSVTMTINGKNEAAQVTVYTDADTGLTCFR